MACIRWHELVCDKCGELYGMFSNDTKKNVRQYARRDGWTCGKRDLCPECNNKK